EGGGLKDMPKWFRNLSKASKKTLKDINTFHNKLKNNANATADAYKQMVLGVQEGIKVGLEKTFLSAVDNMGKGWDKFVDGAKEAAGALADKIKTSLVAAVSEWITAQAMSAIAGAAKWVFTTFPFPLSLGIAAAAVGAVSSFFHNLQYLAEGGIVTEPTLAMIGEAGPEAVVPLNKEFGGKNVTVNVNMPVENLAPENIESVADRMTEAAKDGVMEVIEMSKQVNRTAGEYEEEV
ncbi:MAG: hypothetical protein ACOC5R_05970, partial [Elusimicrobiota bacterium]